VLGLSILPISTIFEWAVWYLIFEFFVVFSLEELEDTKGIIWIRIM